MGVVGCGDIARKRVAPALPISTTANGRRVPRGCCARRVLRRGVRSGGGGTLTGAVWSKTGGSKRSTSRPPSPARGAGGRGRRVRASTCFARSRGFDGRRVRAHERGCGRKRRAARVHTTGASTRRSNASARFWSRARRRARRVQVNAFERFDPAPENPRRWLMDKRQAGGGRVRLRMSPNRVLVNLFGDVQAVRGLAGNSSLNARSRTRPALSYSSGGAQRQSSRSRTPRGSRRTRWRFRE